MTINFLALFVAALSTLAVGSIYYHPKVFGNAWMKSLGLTQEDLSKSNMALIFGLTAVFAFLIGIVLQSLVIHQWGLFSLTVDHQKDPAVQSFMKEYAGLFRTFKHGFLHGSMTGIFFALPLIATNALFERRGWKYILINAGYWTLCLGIMGGIICGWTEDGFRFS